jgi:hypothetical protein
MCSVSYACVLLSHFEQVYVKVSGLFRVSAEVYPYKDLHARVSAAAEHHNLQQLYVRVYRWCSVLSLRSSTDQRYHCSQCCGITAVNIR